MKIFLKKWDEQMLSYKSSKLPGRFAELEIKAPKGFTIETVCVYYNLKKIDVYLKKEEE